MGNRLTFALIALTLAALIPDAAAAQALRPGTRVRISAEGARTVGSVERSTPDSLFLAVPSAGARTFEWAEVERLEVSHGRRGRAGRGALIGAGSMTALTLGMLLFDGSDEGAGEDYDDLILIISLPVNAAMGAGVGALVGLAWRTERWSVIPIGSASEGRPAPGLRLAVRL